MYVVSSLFEHATNCVFTNYEPDISDTTRANHVYHVSDTPDRIDGRSVCEPIFQIPTLCSTGTWPVDTKLRKNFRLKDCASFEIIIATEFSVYNTSRFYRTAKICLRFRAKNLNKEIKNVILSTYST